MLELPTDRDVFPAETELESTACDGCGATGYLPRDRNRSLSDPNKCADCVREELREYLVRDPESAISRVDALSRLSSRNLLPVRDPQDGHLIADVEVDHVPGRGQFVKHLQKVVPRDCPECGHDRADYAQWRAYTCEHGHEVTCRVCGHTFEEESSL